MYAFILNCYIMHKLGDTHEAEVVKVQSYVTKGYITQAEADIIIATPQV